jgi:hypothetical protein
MVSLRSQARFFALENRSYLGEFEAEFKKALACESGPQGVLFDEKTEGRKSLDTVPLRQLSVSKLRIISRKYHYRYRYQIIVYELAGIFLS